MNEKELLKVANMLEKINKKAIKTDFKNQVDIFNELKGILGDSNIERMKIPMEFKTSRDYIEHIKKYVKTHSKDITEYSNRILMLNERAITSESEDEILELYGILMGFSAFLMIKSLDLTEKNR